MKKVFHFLEEGDKVKMTMRFRGREMSHTQLGLNVLQRVAEMTAEIAKIEAHPRTEGRQMLMVLAPKSGAASADTDRKRVVLGKRVSVRGDVGGRRILKKKKIHKK